MGDAARLSRIRYFAVLLVGAVLLALIAQMALNGGAVTLKAVMQVGLIGVLAPGVVFFINHEELGLRIPWRQQEGLLALQHKHRYLARPG
jgi:hypothetical protein